VQLKRTDDISYREALPEQGAEGAPVALALHGFPTSSYLWRDVLPAVAAAGYRALAPDLPGFGDSPPVRPGTWEQQMENVERFRRRLDLERVALLVHDWGGLIGLRWACEHPDRVSALVISDTGFFPDGRWHGLAESLRTPGVGEEVIGGLTEETFAAAMRDVCPTLSDESLREYYKAVAEEPRRRAALELYRSGDFSKLEAYRGRLAALGVPTLIIWGARDRFAPVGGAHRFHKEIPGSKLVVLEDAGHWLVEEQPDRVAATVREFLASHAKRG
jgi:haloalkane dehalogenase